MGPRLNGVGGSRDIWYLSFRTGKFWYLKRLGMGMRDGVKKKKRSYFLLCVIFDDFELLFRCFADYRSA